MISHLDVRSNKWVSDVAFEKYCPSLYRVYEGVPDSFTPEGSDFIGALGVDVPFDKGTPELLTPTTIYSPLIQGLMDEIPILGMAHITGGGIPENLPRCLPEGLKVEVDYNSWERPEIFKKVAEAGEIEEEEMRRVFNLGIGYCLIVPPDINIDNFECWTIGEVVVQ